MTTNPILDEIYAARAKLLADADGDIDRLLTGIRQREAESIRRAATSQSSAAGTNWVEQITGSISDEPAFVEAIEAGREIRHADRLSGGSDK